MCISNTETCTNYETFSTTKEWTLTSGDGEKTVYVYYKNSSGKIIASITKSIILDTTPPSNNSIVISSEDNISRTLTLSSTGADYMCFSNTSSNASDCTNWVNYATTYNWNLTPNSGTKTVYAFFKDKAGNIASTSSSVTCNNCVAYMVNEDFADSTYDSKLTISGSGSYPWIVSGGQFISNNKGVNSSSSTSTIVFTPTYASKLSFDYGVSSESNYDKLTITLTGSDSSSKTLVSAISGTKSGSITDEALSSGVTYTLTLTYSKDSSSASGSDIGYIDNLNIGP